VNFKEDAGAQWWVGHARYEMNMPVLQENFFVWMMFLTKYRNRSKHVVDCFSHLVHGNFYFLCVRQLM